MTVRSDYLDMCPHTVTLEPLSTVDIYGGQSYGTSASYNALVVYQSKLIPGADNVEVVSGTQVYIPSSSCSAAESDRITLPDGTQPRIVRVDRFSDESGAHNVVIYCGRGGVIRG